jgi:hypothetical protein
MNPIIIILGIIVILLAYYIYTILSATPTLANNIDLSKPPPEIKPSSITDPYGINYTIGVWIYIHNFPQNNQMERIISYGFEPYMNANSLWSLKIDKNYPVLYCELLTAVTGSDATQLETFVITDNFPMQKWVYVTTVVSNNFLETYINGRFISADVINSPIFAAPPAIDPSAGPTFRFGGQGTTMDDGSTRTNGSPVSMTHLSRWNYPLSSGDVYNIYNKGNGQKSNIWGPAYNLNITLSQGNNVYTLPVF